MSQRQTGQQTGRRAQSRAARCKTEKPADVSVVIPIYNVATYLDQCLESVEGQTLATIEIICVNDGSTDDSLAIIQRHAASDSRIRIIDKQNQGYGASCNRGIDNATGLNIALIEPDDWIEPDMLKDMIDYARSFDERVDIVKTPYWRICMPDTPKQRKLNCSYRHRIHPPQQPFRIGDAAHLLRHHPSIWSGLYRKSFLDTHAIRFKEIPGAGWADNPFLIETLCQAENIVYLDKPYYCYREETPEKLTDFHRTNALLPFDRWNDMMDVLERLTITDANILAAHNSRGFTYLGGVLEEVGLDTPEIRSAVDTMFTRMDADLVMDDPEIPPHFKRMFGERRGLPRYEIGNLPYLRSLVRQFIYNLRNNGPGYTTHTVLDYLQKNGSHT